jgi:hypothetical protein
MNQSSTILLWRDPNAGDTCGAQGLLHWRSFTRQPADELFMPYGEPAQIGAMARTVLGDAFRRGVNCYVGWQTENPRTTPANEIETAIRRLWPLTIFCPERAIGGDRWCMHAFGESATLSKTAVERTVNDFLAVHIPHWQPGVAYRPHAVVFRVDVTAETLGLIEPHKLSPDEIVSMVSNEPEVVDAVRRWDRATPHTFYQLAKARMAAQARLGIAEEDQCPIHTSWIEDTLTPLMMRMGRDDEASVVAFLRRDCRQKYAELGERVLIYMLTRYPHGNTEKLVEIATRKAAA